MPDSRPRVLVLDDYEAGLGRSPHLAALDDLIDLETLREPVGPDELAVRARGVPFVVTIRERTRLSEEVLTRLPDAELVLQTGGHAYHIDLDAARRHNVMIALGRRSKSSPSPVVAELVLGLMIAWYRNLVPAVNGVRAGGWPASLGRMLSGRTLGVLGFGRHGVTVAQRAHAMGMTVLAWSPSLTPERAAARHAQAAGFDALLARSDVVSVHVPLRPETVGLIGARELRLMGPDTLLINTSRGPVVDEAALVEALSTRTIEGAALDVFDVEPLPAPHPLRTLDNVICTPHLGYTVDAAFEDFAETTARQLRAYLAHDLDPELVLNPEVASRRPAAWGGLRFHPSPSGALS